MQPTPTTPTKMKTRVQAGEMVVNPTAKEPRPQPSPTTPSKTLPSFSPAAARSSPSRKRQSKSPRASADSAPARRSVIPNTAKEPSTSEKEKAKKPNLRYNSLALA